MARPANDYTDIAWGNWIVLWRSGTENRQAAWLCRCLKCGNEQRMVSSRIKRREGVICTKCEAKPPTNRRLCSDEDFVRAWQEADSIDDVCLAIKGGRSQIYAIAARLRGHGVPLKKLKPDAKKHYGKLAALAVEQHNPRQAAVDQIKVLMEEHDITKEEI